MHHLFPSFLWNLSPAIYIKVQNYRVTPSNFKFVVQIYRSFFQIVVKLDVKSICVVTTNDAFTKSKKGLH